MITLEKKDIIVNELIASGEVLADIDVSDLEDYKITSNECDMILRQLEKMGLLDIKRRFSNPSGFTVAVNSGLHDFSLRGGFQVQESILSTQLDKLDVEIQLMKSKLAPDSLEQLNKVFSIFSSACSMIPYINHIIPH